MIGLLFRVIFWEMGLVMVLLFKTPLRKLVILGLDRLKRGLGPVIVKTVAGTVFIVLMSSVCSILSIQKRAIEDAATNPTDQVLMAKHLLEATLMGGSLFLALIIDKQHHCIRELQIWRESMEAVNKHSRVSDVGKPNNSVEIKALEEETSALRAKLKEMESKIETKTKALNTAEANAVALRKQSEGLLLEYDRLQEENQNLRNQLQPVDRRMSRSYDGYESENDREMGNLIGDDTDEKWITHYSSSHMILLVGEGDSFSASMARAFGSGVNMVATSLDSKKSLPRKYSLAKEYLEELKLLGCSIFHKVDVAFMSQQPPLKFMCFDRIVFNFPHAGFYFSEHVDVQIRLHRDLVTEFLRNAKEMLRENGEIHITHKTTHPYSRWEIVKVAEEVGLYLVRKVRFDLLRYPRYVNKRGDGPRCDASFKVGKSSTFMFRKLQIVINLSG